MSYRPARDTTINYRGRLTQGGSGAPGPRRASSTGCEGELWPCSKAAGRDQQRPGSDSLRMPILSQAASCLRVPAWGPGGRGPPVGSRGAATSRRVCPQAERRAGEEPRPLQPRRARPRPSPHGAPWSAAPHRPSPAFSAALALTLHTGHRIRSPQGHRPRTMTRPPVSLNTGL